MKVGYGAFLEMISFCDCFVDYEGMYKDRVEKVGEIILNIAVVFAFLSIAQASYVISQSPTKDMMLQTIASTVFSGIFVGFLSCWATFHYKRVGEIGWKRTNGNCVKQLDKDGDGRRVLPLLMACTPAHLLPSICRSRMLRASVRMLGGLPEAEGPGQQGGPST
jgi:hypothetical protein